MGISLKISKPFKNPYRRAWKQVKRHAKKDSWGALYKSYVAGQEEDAARDVAAAEAGEIAKIETEKLESAKSKLDAKRKKRRGIAGRKGRRASIMSGALGAGEEPAVRRAGVMGL